MQKMTIRIPNANCNHCSSVIRRALSDLNGSVSVKKETPERVFTFSWTPPANWELIKNRLHQLGYTPERQISAFRV